MENRGDETTKDGAGLVAHGTEDRMMRTPAWKWEWNLNTVVILIGFASTLISVGIMWERQSAGQQQNAERIDSLSTRVTAVEAALRITDNHELRITNIERQNADAATAARETNASVNKLSTDVQVIREIVQRIEASQTRSRSPPN